MTTTQTISRDELETLAFNGETHTERALARMLLAALDSEPVDEFISLITRLAHSLKKVNPDSELPAKAMDYLQRRGFKQSPLRAIAPPAPLTTTTEQRRVIEMLLSVCGAAFELADDACESEIDGEVCVTVQPDAFNKLSDVLDEIEETLPTEDPDRPDVFLAWSAMPRAALKSLLYAAPPAPVGYPERLPCPVLLEPGMRIGKGVKTSVLLKAIQRRAAFHAELEAMTPEQRAEHYDGVNEMREMLGVPPLPAPAPVAVPDEQHSERFSWSYKQWAEHLGGRHQNNDPACYYEFGSFMAVAEMLRQFGNVQRKVGWNACRAAMQAEPVTAANTLPEEKGSSLQLRNLIRQRHAEWSEKTFGNVGPVGPLKHLAKEANEAAEALDDLSEWADMQFLLWDAQRRAGITDDEITAAMEEKLKVNMARQWPEPKDGEPRLHIKPEQEV